VRHGGGPIERADVARGLKTLADAFWRGEPSAGTAEVYFEVLGEVSKAAFALAVVGAVRELGFMPSPGKLLELAGYNRLTGKPDSEPEYHQPMPDFK